MLSRVGKFRVVVVRADGAVSPESGLSAGLSQCWNWRRPGGVELTVDRNRAFGVLILLAAFGGGGYWYLRWQADAVPVPPPKPASPPPAAMAKARADATLRLAMAPRRLALSGHPCFPKLLYQVEPVYPRLAELACVAGLVQLRVVIGRDGSVEAASPISGSPAFDAAAIDAVKQWRYQPTLLNGVPIEIAAEVTVTFKPNPSCRPSPTPPPAGKLN